MTYAEKPNPERTTRFEFDGPEGKGVVEIEEGAYGPYIWVNGKCLAMVDLYYLSDAAKDLDDPHPAIVFYEPDAHADALGGIHWHSNEIKVLVEREGLSTSKNFVGTTVTYEMEPGNE